MRTGARDARNGVMAYAGDGVGEHRLAAAGRAVQQEARERVHAEPLVQRRVSHVQQLLAELLREWRMPTLPMKSNPKWSGRVHIDGL